MNYGSAIGTQLPSNKLGFLKPTETLVFSFWQAPPVLYPCDVSRIFLLLLLPSLALSVICLGSFTSFQKELDTSSACGGK